jgi:hypothetical protein
MASCYNCSGQEHGTDRSTVESDTALGGLPGNWFVLRSLEWPRLAAHRQSRFPQIALARTHGGCLSEGVHSALAYIYIYIYEVAQQCARQETFSQMICPMITLRHDRASTDREKR